jgi:hypothetical protein
MAHVFVGLAGDLQPANPQRCRMRALRWRRWRIFQDNIRYTICDHCSATSVAVVAARENMPGTPDWEYGMLAYLPIMAIAILAMMAISVATVALAMVADYYIEIDSFSFGPR